MTDELEKDVDETSAILENSPEDEEIIEESIEEEIVEDSPEEIIDLPMPHHERLFRKICELQERLRCSLFAAALEYCRRIDLDTEELYGLLDPYAIEMLKKSAIDDGLVRQCVMPNECQLSLEFE